MRTHPGVSNELLTIRLSLPQRLLFVQPVLHKLIEINRVESRDSLKHFDGRRRLDAEFKRVGLTSDGSGGRFPAHE